MKARKITKAGRWVDLFICFMFYVNRKEGIFIFSATSTDKAYKCYQNQEFPQELPPQCLHIFQI